RQEGGSRRDCTRVGTATRALIGPAVLAACIVAGVVAAAPVRVRSVEGSAHGFLVLRGTSSDLLAQGDWWQIPSGDRIEVHLRFAFIDGSLSHETFVLSQRRTWTLLSYRSVQRGPS